MSDRTCKYYIVQEIKYHLHSFNFHVLFLMASGQNLKDLCKILIQKQIKTKGGPMVINKVHVWC